MFVFNFSLTVINSTFQYYADANEAESWMNEKLPLVQSDDFGKDEATAKVCHSLFTVYIHVELRN